MKPIKDYEIIDHGMEYSDYFQGCGIAFTNFTDVATGIGHGAKEAASDALILLGNNEWDTENISLLKDVKRLKGKISRPQEDLWWHVSVRVK